VLINNAGLYSSHFKTSDEGIELTYAVNHLAPFLLSLQLLDLVKKSNDGRVITVSSMMHSSASSYLPFNTAKDYNGSEAYSRSKYANVLFTYKLARELKDTKTKSNCLHPGAINTKLLKAAFGPFGKPVNQGAETPVFLAHDTRAKKYNGKYFKDKRPVRSAPETYDKSKQDDLWEKSIELVKNYLP
jgi:NAD(P)-dependent dehydrogenase (short-subunit alcohol dehydrogenase family)